MSIQFKDKDLEARLEAKSYEKLSPSQVACRDLWRYEWLIRSQEPIMLSKPEFYAFASLINAMPHLLQPSYMGRLPLLVEDALLSTRDSKTGQPSKENLWKEFETEAFLKKLRESHPSQLFELLERVEKVTQEEIDRALLAQGR